MRYNMVMARRQVLVQLDDDLVSQLDELGERTGLNRSEILRRSALAFLEMDALRRADAAFYASYRETPQDLGVVEMAAHLSRRAWPEW